MTEDYLLDFEKDGDPWKFMDYLNELRQISGKKEGESLKERIRYLASLEKK